MKYGKELIAELEREIETLRERIENRSDRIDKWETDEDDCFISERVETREMQLAKDKIDLIKRGGCEWFTEYATLDGKLVKANWRKTRFGSSLRAEMPDGSIVWTTSTTEKGLAKKGLKTVKCLRPAWFAFKSAQSGMMGVYAGNYVLFPSDTNYATGEAAAVEPMEMIA